VTKITVLSFNARRITGHGEEAGMAAMKAAIAYAFALLGVMVVIAPSAFADDADLKKKVDQIASL